MKAKHLLLGASALLLSATAAAEFTVFGAKILVPEQGSSPFF